jgi:hypothetical protein
MLVAQAEVAQEPDAKTLLRNWLLSRKTSWTKRATLRRIVGKSSSMTTKVMILSKGSGIE